MATNTNSGYFHAGAFRRSLSLALAASIAMMPSMALPQDDGADEVIEEIITTGTRKQGQSPTESLSPIDVFGGETLANQATFDLTDGLTKISPSINTQRYPIADGTAFIRPVSFKESVTGSDPGAPERHTPPPLATGQSAICTLGHRQPGRPGGGLCFFPCRGHQAG